MRTATTAAPASHEPLALQDWVQDLLREAKRQLSALYGARLQGLYLFGSYARGEESADSDIDLAIVLDEVASYGAEIERTSELVATLSRHYDRSISRVFLSSRQWALGEGPFLLTTQRDAHAA